MAHPSAKRSLSVADDLLVGTRVGDYVVEARIGKGGLGIIYRARHVTLGRPAAVKLLRPEIGSDPEESQRLLAEARSANAISHRGIIDIFHIGELDDGRLYILMEYLPGCSLDRYLRRQGALELRLGLTVLDQVLDALGAAHRSGVTHRDLKSSNVFVVNRPGEPPFIKLLDFGLAKQSPFANGDTPQTHASRIVGTPEFMAPEQARGESVGPRSDLYSLGVMAYEIFTGRLPFSSKNVWSVIEAQLYSHPEPPRTLRPDLPPALEELILHLLLKDVNDRPASAEVVREEVRGILDALPQGEVRWVVEALSADEIPLPPRVSSMAETLAEGARRAVLRRKQRTHAGWVVASLASGAACAWFASDWLDPQRAAPPEAVAVVEVEAAIPAPPSQPLRAMATPAWLEPPPQEVPAPVPVAAVEETPPPRAEPAPAPVAPPPKRKRPRVRPLEQTAVRAAPVDAASEVRAELLGRAERLGRSASLSPVSRALLQKAVADVLTAQSDGELMQVSRYLDSWEVKYSNARAGLPGGGEPPK